MRSAQETLDAVFLEMRWRALSLAADLDRIERAPGGEMALRDPRLVKLREALQVLMADRGNRAADIQMIFSDKSPPPAR